MKAYFLPLGDGANRSLPALLTAFSSGAARQPASVSMLQVAAARPEGLTDRLLADLQVCHGLFAGEEAFAFFRTEWESALWIPPLPEREALIGDEESRLLLDALRGPGVPFSFRTDREAAEWSLSALLEQLSGDAGAGEEKELQPFSLLLRKVQDDLNAGEDVRIMLLCDLSEGFAAGLAAGLLRFFRARLGEAPFLGVIGQVRSSGLSAEEGVSAARDVLASLVERRLVRAADGRETSGADACWLLGLPASMKSGEESNLLLDWAAARVLGEVWTGAARPSAGLHTREIPGILALQTLDQEARPFAAFLRGAVWSLSDLFPALRSFLDHPALLRSLAPASRGALFHRLFRDTSSFPLQDLMTLDRTLRALLLQMFSLHQSLPAWVRDASSASGLWQQAVQACGRAVTLASEYDVRRKEAEDSGIDRVQPVHRTSLADTEEEDLLRRLDQLSADLSAALSRRAEVFAQAGGFLSRCALEDCLAKCISAETAARQKLAGMPSDSPEERYALGMQERRVRLLAAAVARCRQDLAETAVWPAIAQAGTLKAASPWAGEILDPAQAEQLMNLLTAEGEAAVSAARAVRDGLPSLLRGYTLIDAKTLLKNLLGTCRQPDASSPLCSLMAGIFSVCGVEISGLRFQSVGDLPSLSLLPDLTEGERFFSLSAAPARMLTAAPRDDTARIRGLLAFMILRQYRKRNLNEAALELVPLRAETSILTRLYLSSREVSAACLCLLRSGEGEEIRRLPLAVLLPGQGLEPARLQAAQLDLVPSFVYWLDRENQTFLDPCLWLSEGDRQVLTEQLTRLRAALNTPSSRAFSGFLSDWHRDILQLPRQQEDDCLKQRLRIACGLLRLPSWQRELQRVSAFYESSLPEDPVCAALCGRERFEAASPKLLEDVLYVFRSTPLAREHARHLLETCHAPGEEVLLASLDTECDILLHSSDDYHEALAEGLESLLRRFPGADPEAVSAAEDLLREAREPITDKITELTWPWDTHSASVLTILRECLGADLASAALHAFSEKLALFPARGGEILGDLLLSGCCTLRRDSAAPEEENVSPSEDPVPSETDSLVRSDAALPPLSPEFMTVLCRSARGQSLIQPGFLALEPEGSGVRAVLTLEGAFTLKLSRVYSAEEIRTFYAHDLPTLALWPSMPFAREDWHAYFSFAHAPQEFRFTAISESEEVPLSGSAPRLSACQRDFPLCYLVFFGEESLGAIPNLLPPPEIPEQGDWIACLDFGASATSVIFTDGSARWPLQGPVAVRTLLRNPAASEGLLRREFLPAFPVSALLPGALRIFRSSLDGEGLPLRDSVILMSSSLGDVLDVPPDALYTDLKWNGEKGRASRLYLHQVMLMAALEARCGGARTLRWRTAVPQEMPPEGRERLAETLETLAVLVSGESGLPLPEKEPPVAFASEGSAMGAYFRFCSPEQTRGGFMTLDLGADTADLSLFLQGHESPVRSLQLPLGLHNMLLPDLLRRPRILQEDFGHVEDGAFMQDLLSLQGLLERARKDPSALRQARYALDAILADHFPLFSEALTSRRAAGAPGRTGALILLYESFLMMLSGLLLLGLAGDATRNDRLPESMTLFLAGRGSLLTESLSMQAKTSLWKILTMFRNSRVSSLNLLFSAEKKLELPVGLSVLDRPTAALPKPDASPAAVSVRPEELMPEFLLRFRREFPEEAALLFPGVYANDYYTPFTPYGQLMLSQALQAAFGGRDIVRPFPALVSCLNHLLEMIQEMPPAPSPFPGPVPDAPSF